MNQNGFTLIEIMVSVSIFVVVAMITTGALITISDVNRKAQAIKIAMDNVSFAMDSMVTNLREGEVFGCGSSPGQSGTPCDDGIVFVSTRVESECGTDIKYIGYRLKNGHIQFGSLCNSNPGDDNYMDITSLEVNIAELRFYVPTPSQGLTRVTIVIKGQVLGKTPTNFYLQTTVKKI